jgi:hypothetical protein
MCDYVWCVLSPYLWCEWAVVEGLGGHEHTRRHMARTHGIQHQAMPLQHHHARLGTCPLAAHQLLDLLEPLVVTARQAQRPFPRPQPRTTRPTAGAAQGTHATGSRYAIGGWRAWWFAAQWVGHEAGAAGGGQDGRTRHCHKHRHSSGRVDGGECGGIVPGVPRTDLSYATTGGQHSSTGPGLQLQHSAHRPETTLGRIVRVAACFPCTLLRMKKHSAAFMTR